MTTRIKIDKIIIDHGGRNVSAISGLTSYLIVGRVLSDGRAPETGKKYNEAKKLGKKILTEMEFEGFMRDMTNNQDFTLNGRSAPK